MSGAKSCQKLTEGKMAVDNDRATSGKASDMPDEGSWTEAHRSYRKQGNEIVKYAS